MTNFFKIGCLFLLFSAKASVAQDLNYAKKIVKDLTSTKLWGRGYTKGGMNLAADYLEREFFKIGLKPLQQHFSFPVNTFPGEMSLSINGQKLVAGRDFIINPASRGVNTKVDLLEKDSTHYINTKERVLVSINPKLTASVSGEVADYTEIMIRKGVLNQSPMQAEINIENRFVPGFGAANVFASIKGTKIPDSIIIMSAHYDHLGGMGSKTYFPGANDNASGVALLLNLAKHYAKNPAPYTIVFICFAAEEAGLLGSKYFTENPLTNLSKTKFMLNLDLVGTGESGANGSQCYHPSCRICAAHQNQQ